MSDLDCNHQGQQNKGSHPQRSKSPADWLITSRPMSTADSLIGNGSDVMVPKIQVNKKFKKKKIKTEHVFNVSV